jgi:hypothetical protein
MGRPHRSLQLVDPLGPDCRVCDDRRVVEVRWVDGVDARDQLCPACMWELPVLPVPFRTEQPRGVA